MDSLRRLKELFAHFPGIGPRQARRFVYYLLNKSPTAIREFTQLIEEVKKATSECSRCHRFFMPNSKFQTNQPEISKNLICSICADPNRDQTELMVIARDSDFESIEKSGFYKGLYFILGGTIPILDKEPEKRIRLEKLLKCVSDSAAIKEIILSLNTTPDGEHTTDIVKDALTKIISANPLTSTKISILGRGLSTGAELEYADSETIKSALQNRH